MITFSWSYYLYYKQISDLITYPKSLLNLYWHLKDYLFILTFKRLFICLFIHINISNTFYLYQHSKHCIYLFIYLH